MHLSKTSKYAIKLLTHMAVSQEETFRSKELCENLEIPYKYLSSIITTLTKAGILQSSKGRNGGISFACDLNEITLTQIISITENSNIHECVMGLGNCNVHKKCILHDSWNEPKQQIIDKFLEQSLEDIKQNATNS